MQDNTEKHYSLDELCTLTETTKRTVRFYMGQGLMDRSEGQKKGAYYLEKHLMQLLEIKKWQKAGLSLERIKSVIHQEGDDLLPPVLPHQPGTIEVWSHLSIADGVQLQIEANRAGLTPEQVRALSSVIMTEYERLTKTTKNNKNKETKHECNND